jgi:hypothetical protein
MKSKHIGEACEGEDHRWASPRRAGDACRCGRQLLCAQHWAGAPRSEFMRRDGGTAKNCQTCRTLYSGGKYGERGSVPRRALRMFAPEPRVLWQAESKNRKLGAIGAATISAETCPPSCGFYGRGCFAEHGPQGAHWRSAQADGVSWEAFCELVRLAPAGGLWRYAVAGDLPGNGEALDVDLLGRLVSANAGRRGFAISHKKLGLESEREAVRAANRSGFTVNLSADTLEQADARATLGCGPVVVVLPSDAPDKLRTPAGRHVVVCPAETAAARTCETCGLCAVATRRAIIGFRAHGQSKAVVSKIARGEP